MSNIPTIVEIIKKAPMDHIYWCTLCGPCKVKVNTSKDFPITVIGTAVERIIKLDSYGCYVDGYPTGDCVLFPSKGNRDWDSFNKDVNAGIIMRDEAKGKYSDFDIVKAKNGSPVRTRDGHDARIICYDSQGGNYPIIALVKDKTTESEICRYYNADGKSGIGFSDLDLVMAPRIAKDIWPFYKINQGISLSVLRTLSRKMPQPSYYLLRKA